MMRDDQTSTRPWVILAASFLIWAFAVWAYDAQSAIRSGRAAIPVTVEIVGPELGAKIRVTQLSLGGNFYDLSRVPGTNRFESGAAWIRQINVILDYDASSSTAAIVVGLAGASKVVPVENSIGLANDWTKFESVSIQIESSTLGIVPSSALPWLDDVLNSPGDLAVLRSVFRTNEFNRFLICALVFALIFLHARSHQDSRLTMEKWIPRLVSIALVAFFALVLLPTFWSRFSFPLSVEHLEGVQATCTWLWAAQGANLYSEPTALGCGNIYTPGYYLASWAWAQIWGFSMPSLRGLTWFCNLVSTFAAASILRDLNVRRAWLWWAPLFLASFCVYGWLDNANKDPLHIALAMLGMASLVRSLGAKARPGAFGWAATGGLLWGLAFMTKQSHIAIAGLTLVSMLFFARGPAVIAIGSFVFAGVTLTWWAASTWSNYMDWTIAIPRTHEFSVATLLKMMLPTGLAIGGYALVGFAWIFARYTSLGPTAGAERERAVLVSVLAFAVGGIAMGLLSVGKDRGGVYALAPGLAALSIPVAAAMAVGVRGQLAMASPLLLMILSNIGAVQVSDRDRTAAYSLISTVRGEKGEVWVPFEPFVNVAAGKTAYVPLFCIGEWTAAGRPFPEKVLAAVRRRDFDLIVAHHNAPGTIGAPNEDVLTAAIAEHYVVDRVLDTEAAFTQKDGWRNTLRVHWRPDRAVDLP